jgi:FMN reductase
MILPMRIPRILYEGWVIELTRQTGLSGVVLMYNGTISGSFKNALDWLKLRSDRNPPHRTDKVFGLTGTAGGVQGLQAVNTREFVVGALRGWSVPLVMPIAQAWKAF